MKSEANFFLALRSVDANGPPLMIGLSVDDLLKWVERTKDPVPSDAVAQSQTETDDSSFDSQPKKSLVDQLDKLAQRFAIAMASYHPLIDLSSVLASAMAKGIAKDISAVASEKYVHVQNVDDVEIYQVPPSFQTPLISEVKTLSELTNGLSTLPASAILSLVSVYDSYFGELVSTVLSSRPERYSTSEKSISVRDILQMSSFEELTEKLVEDEIDALLRRSHHEQIEQIEKLIGVKITNEHDSLPKYLEVFERRNLIAHGNACFNRYYLENCNKFGLEISDVKIGDKLIIDAAYSHMAVDLLSEFWILSLFAIWRKSLKDNLEELYSRIHLITYDLLVSKRFTLTSSIIEFALNKQNTRGITERTLRMMAVNLAISYKKQSLQPELEKSLSIFDWSASADDFKICIAAIREDFDEVARLMKKVSYSNSVEKSAFRSWPAFDWVRENPLIQTTFFEEYGELLTEAMDISKID